MVAAVCCISVGTSPWYIGKFKYIGADKVRRDLRLHCWVLLNLFARTKLLCSQPGMVRAKYVQCNVLGFFRRGRKDGSFKTATVLVLWA
jgi:hypothetical protein